MSPSTLWSMERLISFRGSKNCVLRDHDQWTLVALIFFLLSLSPSFASGPRAESGRKCNEVTHFIRRDVDTGIPLDPLFSLLSWMLKRAKDTLSLSLFSSALSLSNTMLSSYNVLCSLSLEWTFDFHVLHEWYSLPPPPVTFTVSLFTFFVVALALSVPLLSLSCSLSLSGFFYSRSQRTSWRGSLFSLSLSCLFVHPFVSPVNRPRRELVRRRRKRAGKGPIIICPVFMLTFQTGHESKVKSSFFIGCYVFLLSSYF